MRRDVEHLMRHSLPGPRRQVERTMRKVNTAANVIERERGKKHVNAWQMTDVLWYLENRLTHLSASTRYDHWLAIASALELLGRMAHWERRLDGPWCNKEGKRGKEKGVGGRSRRVKSASRSSK